MIVNETNKGSQNEEYPIEMTRYNFKQNNIVGVCKTEHMLAGCSMLQSL